MLVVKVSKSLNVMNNCVLMVKWGIIKYFVVRCVILDILILVILNELMNGNLWNNE